MNTILIIAVISLSVAVVVLGYIVFRNYKGDFYINDTLTGNATQEYPLGVNIDKVLGKPEAKLDQLNTVSIYGNSDAFRDWLNSQKLYWLPDGFMTKIQLPPDGDVHQTIWNISARWAIYQHLNNPFNKKQS